MEPYSTPPEFEPLPDAWSGEPPTDHERQLLKDVGCNPGTLAVRSLRAGHEAGRRSVLQAPVRVWREGDPPPESEVMSVNCRAVVGVWNPETRQDWEYYLTNHGPLFELPVPVDFGAALTADAARRAALKDGTP